MLPRNHLNDDMFLLSGMLLLAEGMFRTVLLANHVRQLTADMSDQAFTKDDLANIRELGASHFGTPARLPRQ